MHLLESGFITILAAAFVLGILILVHEWGHFVVAKMCGVRVNVFSFGYGPRLWGWKRGDTDYRLSALPFGGYVRMAGDNPSEERTGAPDEFLSRPRWQRFLIAIAGPCMNFLLAIVVMAILFLVGIAEPSFMARPMNVAGVLEGSPAADAGIKAGDKIVEINGQKNPRWEDALFELALASPGKPISVVVDRSGQNIPLSVSFSASRQSRDDFALLGFPYAPVVIDQVTPGSPADKGGLKPGDEVLTLDGDSLLNSVQLQTKIRSSNGQPVHLQVRRRSETVTLDVTPKFADPGDGVQRWQIGILFRIETARQSHSLTNSLYRSVFINFRVGQQIFDVLTGLFEGRFKLKQLEGPIGIARESGQAVRRGAFDFFNWMAVISVNLGILNLLPIPILDGGHVLMLGIEGVLRRDLSLAVKERFVQVGLVFLLAVFAFVMYYDVVRLLVTW
jgi:regulator of sigma E protease